MKKLLLLLALVLLMAPAAVFAQKTTINFVVWNYSLETIQDNLGKFMSANPDI